MKILIVGSFGVHFLSELAERLEDEYTQVYSLDFSTLTLKHQGIEDMTYRTKLKKYSKVRFADRMIRPLLINHILKENDFDIINFQFLYWHYIFSIRTFKKIRAKILFTIFGSDFYRANKYKKRYLYTPILRTIEGIIFTNEKTKEDFTDYYASLLRLETYVCRLGLPALSFIDKHREERALFYDYFDISTSKTIISVGYNLTKEQQHLKAIDALNKLSSKEKENIYVLFPLTYGGSGVYLQEIKNYLSTNATFEYKIFTEYMDNDEISKLRLVTDIMINILQTDQFSGSMQEHLYANNVVVAGAWLPYETMVEKGIYMQRIESVEALTDAISYVLSNLKTLQVKCEKNTRYIAELSSWDNVISCWKHIFN